MTEGGSFPHTPPHDTWSYLWTGILTIVLGPTAPSLKWGLLLQALDKHLSEEWKHQVHKGISFKVMLPVGSLWSLLGWLLPEHILCLFLFMSDRFESVIKLP